MAFNTSHLPKILALPKWGGRVWQPVVDTSKLAPFDCLMPDEVLSQKEVRGMREVWESVEGVGRKMPQSLPPLTASCSTRC